MKVSASCLFHMPSNSISTFDFFVFCVRSMRHHAKHYASIANFFNTFGVVLTMDGTKETCEIAMHDISRFETALRLSCVPTQGDV